jgi:hypothetical protein
MWSKQLSEKEKFLWTGRPEFSVYDNGKAIFAVVMLIAATVGIMVFFDNSRFGSSSLMSVSGFSGRDWWSNPDIIFPLFVIIFLIGALKEFSEAPLFSRYMLSDQRMFLAKIFP